MYFPSLTHWPSHWPLRGSQTSRGSGDSLKPTSEDTGRLLNSLGPTPAPSRRWDDLGRSTAELRSSIVIWALLQEVFLVFPPRAVTIIAETSEHISSLSSPEMSSLQTRGRKLKRVAAARLVGGRVVGPKPCACSNDRKPTVRCLSCQCTTPRPYLWGRRLSHHKKYWKRGGGSNLPSRREPLRLLVAVLVREPRTEWFELTPQPVDDSDRNEKTFAHQMR